MTNRRSVLVLDEHDLAHVRERRHDDTAEVLQCLLELQRRREQDTATGEEREPLVRPGELLLDRLALGDVDGNTASRR